MKKLLLISILTLVTFFANAKEVDFYNSMFYKGDINSHKAYEMQQKGALLIDVRTKKEFNTLRAKDSINIPLFYEQNGKRVFNKEFITQIYLEAKRDVKKQIILICRSGSRTKLGSNLLAYNGFTNIYNVKKGFQYDWSKTNLPVEK